MNIVNYGNQYQIYGEDVVTSRRLPSQTYEVCFSKMKGFYLIKREDLVEREEKIYGNNTNRAEKVMKAFKYTNRNFGVILSGTKGAGKSLLARIIMNKALSENIPVIIVSEYIPGIANFISSINQEVAVLFDEFEKTFSNKHDNNEQSELLPLFDGIDGGKKLFIITCNDTQNLNSYLLNRPGRFHYHFSLSSPSAEEIREYMIDKLSDNSKKYIDKIVQMSLMNEFTYDCLRAIAFDLNMGYSLSETLGDLNIHETSNKYVFHLVFEDGKKYIKKLYLNLYDTDISYCTIPIDRNVEAEIEFNCKDMVYDKQRELFTISADNLIVTYDSLDEINLDSYKKRKIVEATIQKDTFTNKLVI